IEAVHPFHIWTDAWLAERLAWQPNRPTYGLLLRVYRFAEPVVVSYQKKYGGCRSWVSLDELDSLPQSSPVLPTETYEALTEQIQRALILIKTQ
ncbi:MAG: DUF1802 family protein, partial [Leptolyngbya sp. SIO1D8]|nr:DUF1802 family protein [Leptolyngbya sp. SIO1D8]